MLIGELKMSEIESQTNDLNQFNQKLERIFDHLECGTDLSKDQIDDLRYACGLSAIQRKSPMGQFLFEMLTDMNATMIKGMK